MLILKMRRSSLIDARSPHAFLDELKATMQPLIRPVRELTAANLGVDVNALVWTGNTSGRIGFRRERNMSSVRKRRSTWTEIFLSESGFLVIDLHSSLQAARGVESAEGITEGRTRGIYALQASAIMSTTTAATTALDAVSAAVKSHFDVEMADFFERSEEFDAIKGDVVAEDLPHSAADIRAAQAFSLPAARALAIRIRSSRGLLVKDISKIVGNGDPSRLVDALVSAGVAARDVVVVCGVSQAQVARLPGRDSLTKLANDGVRCGCGKPINQESIEDLLTITDLGSLLLDKSRWLSVLVREELVNLGVRYDDVLLECQLGGDEIDCIALIGGDVTIFELKDKEFSMGNAYSFSAKISAINPGHSVILTTDRVAVPVKERFNRVRRDSRFGDDRVSSIEYVEGEGFQSGLQRVVDQIYRPSAIRILDNALQFSVPDANSVLEAVTNLSKPELLTIEVGEKKKRTVVIRAKTSDATDAEGLE